MISQYPKDSIIRFTVDRGCEEGETYIDDVKTIVRNIKLSSLPILSSLSYINYVISRKKYLLKEVDSIIINENIDVIWAIINDIITIDITEFLSENVKKPIITQIWDTPIYLLKRYRLDYYIRRNLLKRFASVMLRSDQSVVVSDSMGRIYNKLYNIKTSTLAYCPPLSEWQDKISYKDKAKLKIIFAGSLYAKKEWMSFINALESIDFEFNNRKVVVTYLGRSVKDSMKRSNINYIDYLPQKEASKLVQESDIAYLPYWLSSKHSYTVQTAFPSKLSFYLSAGTPVFYHGPSDSTPAEFLGNYNVGFVCNSFKKETIYDTLYKLTDQNFISKFWDERDKAMLNLFHPSIGNKLFKKLIVENSKSNYVSK